MDHNLYSFLTLFNLYLVTFWLTGTIKVGQMIYRHFSFAWMYKQQMILGKVLKSCFCFFVFFFYSVLLFFSQAATGSSPCGLKNINFQETLLLSVMHYKHQLWSLRQFPTDNL